MATTTILGLTLTLSPPALTALRLAPLLGSTGSLTHAYMEWLTTTSFLHTPRTTSTLTLTMTQGKPSPSATLVPNKDQIAAAKAIVIPIWFVNFFHTGLYSVIGLNGITTYTSLANILLFPTGLGLGKSWYVVGLAAAVGHYFFVPGVMGSVARLFDICVKGQAVEGEGRGDAVDCVREWVGVHKVRMLTVDLCAWVCFAVGVVRVLTP
ncbi:hypothetical protein P280DRAFT_24347 [Massarina eburnea CBS 473.64]|uniref:Integral membrane protein n=1 Tax=Massarina eburnea CBS 473.64 TaxID=1395130 RepID=A0A6A6RZW4_9PLEO|nr:hypothetical protein P280DRAFT_24347 [Massarina eburnea CBS 473.64]